MNASTLPKVDELAKEFSRILADWLTPSEQQAVINLNRLEPNRSICHSHDFCDPNQAMIEALEKFGAELDVESDEQNALVNAVWDIAKRNTFWFPKEVQS